MSLEFRKFIDSLFGVKGDSGSEDLNPTRKLKHAHAGTHFDLKEWVQNQKVVYGSRKRLSGELETKASQFNGALLGISGELLDFLVSQRPHIVPKSFWGGDLGWQSVKRRTTWQHLLTQNGIIPSPTDMGILIRFYIDGTEWVPHPYVPPNWAITSFNIFSEYIAPSEDAFKLCVHWSNENSYALTRKLGEQMQRFPVRIGASHLCYEHADYANVAFLLPSNRKDLLQIQTLWKGETALADLVKSIFPDACREYAPQWLKGQRIDVFIPSVQVALEYHGEQHFRPVEYFGGNETFLQTKARDQKKANACKNAGVILIEWKYNEPIDAVNLLTKLKAFGIEWPDKHILTKQL